MREAENTPSTDVALFDAKCSQKPRPGREHGRLVNSQRILGERRDSIFDSQCAINGLFASPCVTMVALRYASPEGNLPLDASVVRSIRDGHYMAFIRRKRGQVLLVHNERESGSSRIRQREVHRFTAPSELAEVLEPGAWSKWTQAVAWRERNIEFDWLALRARLEVELEAWTEEPAGATHRRHQKIQRLTSELARELAHVSLAKTADATLIERARSSMLAVRASIDRLLKPRQAPTDIKETDMFFPNDDIEPELPPAEQAFNEGMEHWWAGDRRGALKFFRRALKHDPQHADAHNHLGIAKLEARRLKDAEQHFRAAVEGGERHIERDGLEIPWGILENRPYLRALGNLVLVLTERRRWQEVVQIQERMLEINPNDNQGVRWSIGLSYLRAGDTERAVAAFERTYTEEVGCAFGLALARLLVDGPAAEIGEPLLEGFAQNRYVAPMLLGEDWKRLDAFHGTNMAEPEWADDVVSAQAALWHRVPRGAEVLRFWWAAAPVAAWRQKLDEVMVKLQALPVSDERSALVAQGSALRSEATIAELIRTVRMAS